MKYLSITLISLYMIKRGHGFIGIGIYIIGFAACLAIDLAVSDTKLEINASRR